MLPRVLLAATNVKYPPAIAIRPEFVADFAAVHGITNPIEGEPFSRFRKLLVYKENGTEFYAIERRGYRGYLTQKPDLEKYLAARELWRDPPPPRGMMMQKVLPRPTSVCKNDRARWTRSRLSSRLRRRARLLAETEPRGDGTRAPPGFVRLGLGQSRSPYFSFVAQTFPRSHESLGNAGLPSSRTLLRRVAGGLGRADRLSSRSGRNHDLQRRRSLPRRNGNRFLQRTAAPGGEKLRTIGLWVGLHGESFSMRGCITWSAALITSACASSSPQPMYKTMARFPISFSSRRSPRASGGPVRPERITQCCGREISSPTSRRRNLRTKGAIGSHLENLQRKRRLQGLQPKISQRYHRVD